VPMRQRIAPQFCQRTPQRVPKVGTMSTIATNADAKIAAARAFASRARQELRRRDEQCDELFDIFDVLLTTILILGPRSHITNSTAWGIPRP
jgi:hypothetical protein